MNIGERLDAFAKRIHLQDEDVLFLKNLLREACNEGINAAAEILGKGKLADRIRSIKRPMLEELPK